MQVAQSLCQNIIISTVTSFVLIFIIIFLSICFGSLLALADPETMLVCHERTVGLLRGRSGENKRPLSAHVVWVVGAK